jgi:hypothetical protein
MSVLVCHACGFGEGFDLEARARLGYFFDEVTRGCPVCWKAVE